MLAGTTATLPVCPVSRLSDFEPVNVSGVAAVLTPNNFGTGYSAPVTSYQTTSGAPTLTGITVTPATASIVAGTGTQQYAAQCSYSNSTNSNCTATVTWSSSNLAAATISSTGLASARGGRHSNHQGGLGKHQRQRCSHRHQPTLTGISVTPGFGFDRGRNRDPAVCRPVQLFEQHQRRLHRHSDVVEQQPGRGDRQQHGSGERAWRQGQYDHQGGLGKHHAAALFSP